MYSPISSLFLPQTEQLSLLSWAFLINYITMFQMLWFHSTIVLKANKPIYLFNKTPLHPCLLTIWVVHLIWRGWKILGIPCWLNYKNFSTHWDCFLMLYIFQNFLPGWFLSSSVVIFILKFLTICMPFLWKSIDYVSSAIYPCVKYLSDIFLFTYVSHRQHLVIIICITEYSLSFLWSQ